MDVSPQAEVRCQDASALLDGLAPGSVPLIVCDPPYGVGYHSNYYKGRNPHAPIVNDWSFDAGSFLASCERALADGGACYLFTRYDVLPYWMCRIQETGLKLKTVIVWVKDNWSAGDLAGSFGNQYEQILFLTKGRHLLRGHRWSNVWSFPRIPARKLLHPSQKPTPLLERAILASSEAGDLMVDPCCGSGSTGEAAISARRRALLGDIDPVQAALAERRLGLSATIAGPPVRREERPDVALLPRADSLDPDDLRWVLGQLRAQQEAV